MKETILITGATGFLGSHLVKRLIEKYRIIILKRTTSNTFRINDVLDKLICYDVDKVELAKVFSENKIDLIIHTATNYGRNGEDLSVLIKDNVEFPVRLLENCIKYKIKVFINTNTFLNDRLSYNYLSNYIFTKNKFLSFLQSNEFSRIKRINFKLNHVYGPFDNEKKFVPWLIINIINKTSSLDFTLGDQKRDFIFVSDVVNAYEVVLNNLSYFDLGFHEIEVATGNPITIKEFVYKVKFVFESFFSYKVETKFNFGTLKYRDNEFFDIKSNLFTLFQLNWKPEFDIEKGLIETINFYLNTNKN